MKLVVQIPCFNEEETLPRTIRDIPRAVPGVDEVEILVVDDGSSDRTAQVARDLGCRVVQHKSNRGLAQAFRTALDEALRLGADVIVNTDGDNQYRGRDIERLVAPITRGEADIVVGDRRTQTVPHFGWMKKRMQHVGSSVVRNLSGLDIPDAVSGFRAFSRTAAFRINIVSTFSYTIETLIQAGSKHLVVASVPVATNAQTRPSRLFRSIPHFVQRSIATMLRVYSMYQPLRVFLTIGLVLGGIGLLPIVRFLYFYSSGSGRGHVQSLVLGGALLAMGFATLLIAMLADLISFNRQLLEMALERVRRLEHALDRDARTEGTESTVWDTEDHESFRRRSTPRVSGE